MSGHMAWEARHQDDRVATNADQAELLAIRYGSSNSEAGISDDRIAGSLDDYDVPDPLSASVWASDDLALDSATSDISAVIRHRQEILGPAYPFQLHGNRLVYRESHTLAYEFCLVASQSCLSEGEFVRLPRAFERLARDVLVLFLGVGQGTGAFRTGWPGDEFESRPPRFKSLMAVLHELTGEWTWAPAPHLPEDPTPRDVKDEGLDVVVWKRVLDERGGSLFLLVQCACGNDYATKFDDIDVNFDKLGQWLRPISCARPVRVFCTPRHIPNDSYFLEINRRAGLTFDRIRITLLAENEDVRDYVPEHAREPYAELIQLAIDGFEVDSQAPSPQPRKAAAGRRSRSRGSAASPNKRRKRTGQENPVKRRTRGS